MIAATYDCGCIPGKITHGHPNCFESSSTEGTVPRYTLLRCQDTAPPPSCPNSDCCKSSGCGLPTSCGTAIPSCPNFDKIHYCNCSPEPPILSELSDDCACKLKESDGCVINKEGQCDPCSTQKQEKVVSKIAKKGLPYKEIEAIINNNRMVIRMQKEPIEDEFEPPCDCPEGPGTHASVAIKGSTSKSALESAKRCGDDVIYEMTDFSKPGYTCGGQNSMLKQTCDQKGKTGRTITLYPHAGIEHKLPEDPDEKEKEKRDKRAAQDKAKAIRPIDLEENPNIFLLRIRKISNSSDGKQKFDLEFRTPRPWLKRQEPSKRPIQAQPQIAQRCVTMKSKVKRRNVKGKKKKKKKK